MSKMMDVFGASTSWDLYMDIKVTFTDIKCLAEEGSHGHLGWREGERIMTILFFTDLF